MMDLAKVARRAALALLFGWLALSPAAAQSLEKLTILTRSGQPQIFEVEVMRDDAGRWRSLVGIIDSIDLTTSLPMSCVV